MSEPFFRRAVLPALIALVVAAAMAPAQADAPVLATQLSKLSWLLGDWSCSIVAAIPGQSEQSLPSARVRYTVNPATRSLMEFLRTSQFTISGSLAFAEGRYVEELTGAAVQTGPASQTVSQLLQGQDVDVTADRIDLSGTAHVTQGDIQLRSLRQRISNDAYTESGFLLQAGTWMQVESSSCKRV